MTRKFWMCLLSSLVVITVASPVKAETSTLVSIQTTRGVKQSFILIKPEKPVAAVILFAGGHGALGLQDSAAMRWGALNFLVRTRQKFAAANLIVVVMDAPADQQQGMTAVFRISREHADDISSVARYIKGQASVPVWLIGTSMGTFSAAGGAIGAKGVDGLILTSTITRSKPEWKIATSHASGVASMALTRVNVPTLVMSHRKDGCDITPAADAPKLVSRLTAAKPVEVILLDGGAPPKSDPCQAQSEHGFFGIENEAVGKMVSFVKAHSK